MSSQQPVTSIMDKNSLNFKSVVKSLEIAIRSEVDQQKKRVCNKILQKFNQTANSIHLKQLDPENHKKVVDARTQLKLFKSAFQKLTQTREQYKHFKIANPGITEHLINMQQKIDANDFKASYLRALYIKKKDFNWTKQFIQDWTKAVDQQKKNHQQKALKQLAQRNNQIKNQPLPNLGQPVQPVSNQPPIQQYNQGTTQPNHQLKLQQKKQSMKTGQKSTQKIQGQKPEKKVKKDQTGQKIQKQRKPRTKKQVDQSQSSQNQNAKQQAIRKKQQKQARQLFPKNQKPKQPKNRVKLLAQYLSNRKQFSSLHSQTQKLNQIAEYINQNLEKFMKYHLSHLVDIAKLRNKKNTVMPGAGNEFNYFSKDGYNTSKFSSHQVPQDGVKMIKVTYKPKLQLYSVLRTRQQLLQQSLMKMYISKKDSQSFKSSDKKLWQYLLRPSQVLEKTQTYIEPQQRPSQRLSIELNHIRYLFQSHKYIRNSWLMMFCYNS